MKNKLKELDVDFIGDGKPLTKQEEQKIRDFLRNNKKSPKSAKSASLFFKNKIKIY